MTGNCTRECTEFGHSDSCWMPGQPSSPGRKTMNPAHSQTLPNPKTNTAPKLSTFVPYSSDAESAHTPPAKEERSAATTGTIERGTKMANMRFMTPYNSAYTTSAGSEVTGAKECKLEDKNPGEYHSNATPAGQTAAKREIYL